MRRIGGLRQITALDFMAPLGTRLDPLQAVRDCPVYGTIIAKFEMQKWQSDNNNYSFQSPSIVGIGATLTCRY